MLPILRDLALWVDRSPAKNRDEDIIWSGWVKWSSCRRRQAEIFSGPRKILG